MGQALVLAGALALAGGPAERRLAAAVAVLAGMMMVFPLGATGRADPPLIAAFFPLALPLALGPLLYAYIHQLAMGRGMRREVAHFIPAIAQCFYGLAILALPVADGLAWKEVGHDNWVKPIVEGAVILSLTVYSIAGLRLLRSYRSWLGQNRSDADHYAARWIGRVLGVLLLSLACLIVFRIYVWFIAELDTGAFHGWLGIFAAWLGIEGLRHSERIFPPMRSPAPVIVNERSPRDWAAIARKWQQETEQAGWWREPDLTLATLAKRLGTNSNYLSRAINEGLGTNFNAFINRMRAGEVAQQLSDRPSSDLLRLALEAGFSSKATFNRAFRSEYGVSPSEYRRLKS